MKKDIGPGVIVAAIVIVLVIVVFAGMKMLGPKAQPTPQHNAAYDAYDKSRKFESPTGKPVQGAAPVGSAGK